MRRGGGAEESSETWWGVKSGEKEAGERGLSASALLPKLIQTDRGEMDLGTTFSPSHVRHPVVNPVSVTWNARSPCRFPYHHAAGSSFHAGKIYTAIRMMEPSPLNENGGDSSLQQVLSLRLNRFFPSSTLSCLFCCWNDHIYLYQSLGNLWNQQICEGSSWYLFFYLLILSTNQKSLSS